MLMSGPERGHARPEREAGAPLTSRLSVSGRVRADCSVRLAMPRSLRRCRTCSTASRRLRNQRVRFTVPRRLVQVRCTNGITSLAVSNVLQRSMLVGPGTKVTSPSANLRRTVQPQQDVLPRPPPIRIGGARHRPSLRLSVPRPHRQPVRRRPRRWFRGRRPRRRQRHHRMCTRCDGRTQRLARRGGRRRLAMAGEDSDRGGITCR